jgi:hypothetical protein
MDLISSDVTIKELINALRVRDNDVFIEILLTTGHTREEIDVPKLIKTLIENRNIFYEENILSVIRILNDHKPTTSFMQWLDILHMMTALCFYVELQPGMICE